MWVFTFSSITSSRQGSCCSYEELAAVQVMLGSRQLRTFLPSSLQSEILTAVKTC